MSQHFLCGWEEQQDVDVWDTATGIVSHSNTYVRSGSRAGIIYPGNGQSGYWRKQFYSISGAVWYAGVGLYISLSHAEASAQNFLVFEDNSGNWVIGLKLTSARKLQLFASSGGSQIGSDSAAMATGQWHFIELKGDDYTGTCEAKLNGTSIASGSGGNYNLDRITLGFSSNLTGDVAYYVDDFVLNTNAGSVNNSWVGAANAHIVRLGVDGDGTYQEGARGGADSGSNWGQVDELPWNDATDYYNLDANNDRFDCTLEAADGTGKVPTGSSINSCQVWCRVRGATGSSSCSFKHRIISNTNVQTESSAIVYNEAGTPPPWCTSGDPTITPTSSHPGRLGFISETDPNTSAAWTISGLNSAQIGISAPDASPDIYVSTLWLLVNYTSSVTHYSLTVDAGSYSVSGQTATLARGLKMTANIAEYVIAGQAATLSFGYTMAAAAASYALSVADTAWKRTYAVAADAASYAISGLAATLARGLKLTADAGSYTFTGQAATFSRGFSMVADAASYAVSVAAATSRRTYAVAGEAASYALSASAATLARGLKLAADAGSYTTTGMAATLAYGRAVVAAAGSFLVSGQDAVVALGRKLAALLGEYVVAVEDATLTVTAPNTLQAGEASYAISFSEATLTYSGEAETRRPFWVPSGRPTIKALAANVFRGRPGRAPALGRGGRR